MSKGEEVLAQLKFDSEVNIAKASLWSDEELTEMMETYKKTHLVATETKNSELLMIVNEKISQLNEAIELKKSEAKRPSISSNQPTA